MHQQGVTSHFTCDISIPSHGIQNIEILDTTKILLWCLLHGIGQLQISYKGQK